MKNKAAFVFLMFAAVACSREAEEPAPSPATAAGDQPAATATRATGVVGPEPTEEELERARFDNRWRQLVSFREGRAPSPTPSQGALMPEREIQFAPADAPAESDSLETLNPEQIDQRPLRAPLEGDVSGASVLRAQTLLDRVGFSPGVIDGRWGKNTEIAVWWFQRGAGIQPTGTVDQQTWRALVSRSGSAPTLARHTLKASDVEGPFVDLPDDVYEKAKLDCQCYESLSEKLGEMFHSTPELLATINRGTTLDNLKEGDRIWVPAIGSGDNKPVSRIQVSVQGNYLHGFDGNGNVIFHAPTTLGSEFDPSPTEKLRITAIAQDPDFHYQPKLFHDVPDEEEDVIMPPGPNSPVGVVWMALSKPHYGIHGTSNPSSIGYATSHGCVRLTNWDARNLSRRVEAGVEVDFTDTRGGGSGSGSSS